VDGLLKELHHLLLFNVFSLLYGQFGCLRLAIFDHLIGDLMTLEGILPANG
jgi:hypothetical protein